MEIRRLTLFAGHYGSGKTNIALNWAYYLKSLGRDVTVADLDIVNPYFRTKDSERELAEQGIRLIVSPYANSNVDFPAMPKEIYGIIGEHRSHGVLDIGGDDRGALALGRYVPAILEENNYEMLLVINGLRPLTDTPEATLEVVEEIQQACGLPFTAIVNNTNLGKQTTMETVLKSRAYAEAVSRLSGLPIKMTTVARGIYDRLADKEGYFPLDLQKQYYEINTEEPLWQN